IMSKSEETVSSSSSTLDNAKLKDFVEKSWEKSVLKTLKKKKIYVHIYTKYVNEKIYENGQQEKAVKLLSDWVKTKEKEIKGLKMEVLEEKNMTPFIFIEVEAFKTESKQTVLMYGHFDKQPVESIVYVYVYWEKDLHPYKPVIRDGKLYGRGGADDGYSIFAAIDSIASLQSQGASHPRCVITIEGSEESGSPHLYHYLDKLKNKIGEPSLVICLDSGAGNYEQLWITTSLRGILIGYIRAQLLKEGIHSGASGKVRDSFHIIRNVLDRFDDNITGKCKINELNSKIPDNHIQYAKEMAKHIGELVWTELPLCDNVQCQIPLVNDENAYELLLNSTWRPQLTITGCDGIPNLKGGNVLRQFTTLKLSIRLPPDVNPEYAYSIIKQVFEKDPPFNSKVDFITNKHWGQGFVCPDFQSWLFNAIHSSSKIFFNQSALMLGEGGSIPLMGQLLYKFPKSQFVVTGVLGPNSNAHGPNEFLHIDFCKKLICCVAHILHKASFH
ncbi:hypothetical protein RFI_07354, partial [Reticulomyxa filosa]